jgi:hypothetical protein
MQVFARGQDLEYGGLTPGFLEGPQHQRLVRGRNPRHRGVLVGEGAVPALAYVYAFLMSDCDQPGLAACRCEEITRAFGALPHT